MKHVSAVIVNNLYSLWEKYELFPYTSDWKKKPENFERAPEMPCKMICCYI